MNVVLNDSSEMRFKSLSTPSEVGAHTFRPTIDTFATATVSRQDSRCLLQVMVAQEPSC